MRIRLFWALAIVVALAVSCTGTTVIPERAIEPLPTPQPTSISEPGPTATPVPSATPVPTATPEPPRNVEPGVEPVGADRLDPSLYPMDELRNEPRTVNAELSARVAEVRSELDDLIIGRNHFTSTGLSRFFYDFYNAEIDRTMRVQTWEGGVCDREVDGTYCLEAFTILHGDARGAIGDDYAPFADAAVRINIEEGWIDRPGGSPGPAAGDWSPLRWSEAEVKVARAAIEFFVDAPSLEPPEVGAVEALDPAGPLAGLRIGLIANQASVVGGESTIDLFAAAEHVDLVSIFAPEHGPRGTLGAGAAVPGGIDNATGVTVHSLYGETRSPTPEMLAGLDALVYDLQGVGARHYTFISTMGLAMQSAAAAGIPFIVLDRPNPLGQRIDGYVLEPDWESFVGLYPIAATHGLTAGELAQAIVGEGWLDGLGGLDLRVVPVQGWYGGDWRSLDTEWVAPSPGLPTFDAALAYPGTVLFEATSVSFGRGTEYVFRQIGAPWIDDVALADELNGLGLQGVVFEPVTFVPEQGDLPTPPRYAGQQVRGVRWRVVHSATFEPVIAGVAALGLVVAQGEAAGVVVIDRPDFLALLAGTRQMQELVEDLPATPWEYRYGWAVAFDQGVLLSPYRLYEPPG